MLTVFIKLLGGLPILSGSGKESDFYSHSRFENTLPPSLCLSRERTPRVSSVFKLRLPTSDLFGSCRCSLGCSHYGNCICHPKENFLPPALPTFRLDAGHTCGDITHPLAPGTKYLEKGCLCLQVVRNSLWNKKRQDSPKAMWVWGRENTNSDAIASQ